MQGQGYPNPNPNPVTTAPKKSKLLVEDYDVADDVKMNM